MEANNLLELKEGCNLYVVMKNSPSGVEGLIGEVIKLNVDMNSNGGVRIIVNDYVLEGVNFLIDYAECDNYFICTTKRAYKHCLGLAKKIRTYNKNTDIYNKLIIND